MNLIKAIIIISISIFTLFLIKRDSKNGISLAVFLLVLMPRELFIEVGGGLPTITGYRAIMMVIIFYSLFLKESSTNWPKTPIFVLLILVLVTKSFSLCLAFDFNYSLDRFLVFALEIVAFYAVLVSAVTKRETMNAIINSLGSAIIVIAILGVIERYTQFNPVDYISLSGHARFNPENSNVVYSTFSHPIHFGTALVMGWPICLYMVDRQKRLAKRHLLWCCLLFLYAGLYFSQSRGPWLGFVGTAGLLVLLKYPRITIKMAPILILTVLILIWRPGVYRRIYSLSAATLDDTSLEGASFYYRLELYKKAYSEISKSPERLAFGYGPGAHHSMDLRGTVSYGSGREHSFWSWDSEFAVILLEEGFIGLIVNLILYLLIFFYLTKRIRLVHEEDRGIIIALIASISMFIFMMTNVAMFSPQLHFILWTNIAVGIVLSGGNYGNAEIISGTVNGRA